jgi:hypothetical protein
MGQSSAFVDRRRIGRSAPIPVVRETTVEPLKSTLNRPSWPRQRIVRLAVKRTSAPDF